MRIPKKIQAYGFKYQVILQKRIKGNFMGEIDHTKQVITIATHSPTRNVKWSKERKEETLLHEIIHLVGVEENLRLKEKQVDNLSKGLFHILKDNKII